MEEGLTLSLTPTLTLARYIVKKNEWRKISSPTAPPPRSSHQVVTVPTEGGQLFLFGGEFSSPSQQKVRVRVSVSVRVRVRVRVRIRVRLRLRLRVRVRVGNRLP